MQNVNNITVVKARIPPRYISQFVDISGDACHRDWSLAWSVCLGTAYIIRLHSEPFKPTTHKNYGDQRVQFEIIINVLVSLFNLFG